MSENNLKVVDLTTDTDIEPVLAEVPKTELEKLVDMIEEKHPEWNVEVTDIGVWLWVDEKCVYDVVCHPGTYGYEDGLLEGWTGKRSDDTDGWLTAEEALILFEKALKGQGKDLEEI